MGEEYFYKTQEQWGPTKRTMGICEQGIADDRAPEHGGRISRYRADWEPFWPLLVALVVGRLLALHKLCAPCVICGFVFAPKPYGGYLYIFFWVRWFGDFGGVVVNFTRMGTWLGILQGGNIVVISSIPLGRVKMRNMALEL